MPYTPATATKAEREAMDHPPPKPSQEWMANQRAAAEENQKNEAFPFEIKMLQNDINNLSAWVLDVALAGKLKPRQKRNLQTYLNIIKDRIESM